MIRFLFGLILGGAVSAIGLGAAAVLNPLPGGPVSQMPEGPAARTLPEPDPTSEAEPDPAAEPEPEPEPAPEPAPQPEVPATETGSAAPTAPEAPSIGTAGGFTGSTAPEGSSGPGLTAPTLGGADSSGLSVSSGSDGTPVRSAEAPQVAVATSAPGSGPSVNTESAAVPEVGEVAATDYAAIVRAAGLPSGNALTSNAAIFNGDLSKPLMGIVLIDTGEAGELRSGLTALSAPITFGVATDLPNATAVARGYRDAGFEVAAALPASGAMALEEGISLEAVAARLGDAMVAVPSATTVLDAIDGAIPQDREMMNVVLEALKVTGHGLLTHSAGAPNTVPQFADAAGVFSDAVTRVIDQEPGGAANVALALERSVEDARRNGAVIVVGRMNQETVTTLFQWLLGADPRDVTIAPISAVLR